MTDAFGNALGTVYDENGDVLQQGDGVITTDEFGRAQIKNLRPGKYGVIVVPPATDEPDARWQQTTTIEGKKVIDAWVKANEPPFFVEFGPPGFHAFFGFVKKFQDASFPDQEDAGARLHQRRRRIDPTTPDRRSSRSTKALRSRPPGWHSTK